MAGVNLSTDVILDMIDNFPTEDKDLKILFRIIKCRLKEDIEYIESDKIKYTALVNKIETALYSGEEDE